MEKLKIKWNPCVMIDKDQVERKGVELCGMLPILCHWHARKILERQIRLHFRTKDGNHFWKLFLEASRCIKEKQLNSELLSYIHN